jgi:hypothetical protein
VVVEKVRSRSDAAKLARYHQACLDHGEFRSYDNTFASSS